MSTPTSTPEAVQQLVESATAFLEWFSERETFAMYHEGALTKRFSDALVPFQPDPEEALIKKMALAYANAADLNLLVGDEITVDRHMNGIRAALAVVKRKGLPT